MLSLRKMAEYPEILAGTGKEWKKGDQFSRYGRCYEFISYREYQGNTFILCYSFDTQMSQVYLNP